MTLKSRLSLVALATLLIFSACQKEIINDPIQPDLSTSEVEVEDRSGNSIVDIAVGNANFSTLVAAVVKTNLVSFLNRSTLNGTVFAPTNAAFAQLPAPFNNAANINGITNTATINALRDILRYHVLAAEYSSSDLLDADYSSYNLFNGIAGSNILTVSRSLSGGVFINGNTEVVATDIVASNGTIHVINKVLIPPSQTIAQIALGNSNFTALVAALQKTNSLGLVTLYGNRTVFAPTNAAFAQLPAPFNNAANISAISNTATINALRNILRYHLINARVFSPSLREGQSVGTLFTGNNLTITLAGGAKVKGAGNANGSNITAVDILATNGVIHVIDQVLLP
jgi:uncharacterized surface protein with fasciclin (FAS1) repeats